MRTADRVLEESFLEVRAKLLEVAATLDRVDRSAADGPPVSAGQMAKRDRIDNAIRICLSKDPDRAERLQNLFSREYETNWREQMQI